LLHGDMKFTYKEINAGANSVANSLLRLGIKKGDKVCVIMTNSVEYFHTWFALAKIGAVIGTDQHRLERKLAQTYHSKLGHLRSDR